MNKVYVIYGPTASGKTKLAIDLAKKLDGEIINADSRQIYQGMDIGTAKEIPNGVKSHLFDITAPDKQLSLAQYQKLAYKAMQDILTRGKTPILVGGTGLYIDSLVKGYSIPQVAPNPRLRNKLEKFSIKKLQEELKKLEPDKLKAMNNSDSNNPRRLIRAIEVAKSSYKKVPGYNKDFQVIFRRPKVSWPELEESIDKRVEQMFKDGLIKETQKLVKKYGKDIEPLRGMGYKEVIDYLDGKITLGEAKKLIKTAHRQYAKRQETWFKKYIG